MQRSPLRTDVVMASLGPLPGVLLLLTVLTGIVDAVSYIKLGHVFVANMTGNVVFLGFAAAGATDVAAISSISAIVAFLGGAVVGGRLAARFVDHRGRMLIAALAIEFVLLVTATTIAAAVPLDGSVRLVPVLVLGATMGLQNAVVRKVSVADLTTTVLTLTLTGIAADSSFAGGHNVRFGRRIGSVAAMAFGALAGGLLALRVGVWAALLLASVVVVLAIGIIARTWRERPAWAVAA